MLAKMSASMKDNGFTCTMCKCLLFVLIYLTKYVNGGLIRGEKQCGDYSCNKYEFCNSDSFCESCSIICDNNTNNFESGNCENKCQDYLHDEQYVKLARFIELQGKVNTLQSMVIFFFLFFMALVLICVFYSFCDRYKDLIRKQISKKKSQEIKNKMSTANVVGNNNGSPAQDNRLTLKIPPPIVESEMGCPQSAVTTTTPLSTRHPSEDDTLEYAYDNPAMAPSPPVNARRTETAF